VIPVYVAWSDLGRALEISFIKGPLRVYGLAPVQVYIATSVVTLAIIALGTLEIMARLSQGRGEIAALLAGRPIRRDGGRDDERRLVNIVDELSIASGLAAPPLYVLNREQGINAFAAGASPSQAVIVVTQGALEQLSRDELQAVIAHEFSHILNGDIRLNLRAVCVLQGIVFLAAIGRFMMQYYSGAGTEEGRSFFHLPLAVVGVGLFAVGSVGLLFCRIIQASISRERENLADASAVRFTRNADALCGALARIQVNGEGFAPAQLAWRCARAHALRAAFAQLVERARLHASADRERMRRINAHMPPEVLPGRSARRRDVIMSEEGRRAGQAAAPARMQPKTIVPKRITRGGGAHRQVSGMPDAGHVEYAADLLALPDDRDPSRRSASRWARRR
jgi:Zn-dependent protease with chaperone function